MRGSKWPALLARAETSHADPVLTDTIAPDPSTPAAVGVNKRNSKCARPTDGQTTSTSPPANPASDVTSAVSFGGSDGNSDYVELSEKSPTSPANTLDLVGHIIKLEAMHEVSEGEIDATTQPTVLFYHTNEIKILELADAKTDPPENI